MSDIVERIPGVTGVSRARMDDAPPLLALRADERFASASVIKLAIMATVYRAYDAGSAAPGENACAPAPRT